MYCANCGVKLGDSEKVCPLCETPAFHPNIKRGEGEPLYPKNYYPYAKQNKITRSVIMTALTLFFLIISFICILCDYHINKEIVWSGFVFGAVMSFYFSVVFPFWWKKPNPVIFTPVAFVPITLYLLYICVTTGGSWFMSLAFPTSAILALIISTTVTLLKYLKRGKLYVWGGAMIALGGFTLLLELFISRTFLLAYIWWSLYSMVPLTAVGLTLIFFAISPSARENMERRFFV